MTDREGEHRDTYLGYLFSVSHFLTRHFETLNKYFWFTGDRGHFVFLYSLMLQWQMKHVGLKDLVPKPVRTRRVGVMSGFCCALSWWCQMERLLWLSDCRRLSNHLGQFPTYSCCWLTRSWTVEFSTPWWNCFFFVKVWHYLPSLGRCQTQRCR